MSVILKMTPEFIIDLFTPGIGATECIKGLPKDITLVSVSQNNITNIITFEFDDGNGEQTTSTLTFQKGQ